MNGQHIDRQKIKNKIRELKKRLNSMATPENLNNEEVLKVSKQLDELILHYYRRSTERKE